MPKPKSTLDNDAIMHAARTKYNMTVPGSQKKLSKDQSRQMLGFMGVQFNSSCKPTELLKLIWSSLDDHQQMRQEPSGACSAPPRTTAPQDWLRC